MPQPTSLRNPEASLLAPGGEDSLAVRQRYLRRRIQQRRFGQNRLRDRGWMAAWVAIGALVSWLFIIGFAGLGH